MWWPSDAARRQAREHTDATRRNRVLAGQVRASWVPPFCRLLPDGYQASPEARDEYADSLMANHAYTWRAPCP